MKKTGLRKNSMLNIGLPLLRSAIRKSKACGHSRVFDKKMIHEPEPSHSRHPIGNSNPPMEVEGLDQPFLEGSSTPKSLNLMRRVKSSAVNEESAEANLQDASIKEIEINTQQREVHTQHCCCMQIENLIALNKKYEWICSQPTQTASKIFSLNIEMPKKKKQRRLGDQSCETIKSLLQKLPNILSLGIQLPNQKIDCGLFGRLNASLQSLSRLHLLIINLNDNCITGKAFLEFASNAHNLVSLKNLGITLEKIRFNLSDNFDIVKGLCKLSHICFDKCSFLSDHISYNQTEGRYSNICIMLDTRKGRLKLGDKGCERLAEALEDMQNLNIIFLEIPHNHINKSGFMHLVSRIRGNGKLKHLYFNLEGNRINDDCVHALSSAIQSLSRLNSLIINLGRNAVTNTGLEELRSAIISKPQLLSLRLSINSTKIEKVAVKDFCESIPSLSSLISLVVDINAPGAEFEVLDNLLKKAAYFPFLTKIIIIIPIYFLENADNYDNLRTFVTRSDAVRFIAKRREMGVNISKAYNTCMKAISLRKEIKREIFKEFLMDSMKLCPKVMPV